MKHKKLIRIMLWLINASKVLLIVGGAILLITLLISAIYPTFKPKITTGAFLFKPISEATVAGQYISGGIHEKLMANIMIVKFTGINPETHVLWILAVGIFLALVITFYILKQLAILLNNLLQDKVFVRDNAIRLRYTAIAMITGWLVTLVLSLILTVCFRNVIVIPGYQLQFFYAGGNWYTPSLTSGIILLIIAEVFRIGTEMKEDSDLTI